ncbi:enoyl-CoA hydratase/isomerase family protein [Paracoccus xiamenensis]|uniref:enoyl-CoA hydratase/isomerase family protein n=1 Tax=Paracoccus xiamenensis TaxID=2714901 RepID=UPI00140AFD70|nr:enoyl-CoA hydratase/isomerase family protein [Paracoccus xiamenensis]NHF71612.1 enoyl-CoA hydratase/isomerase family protein [Paracoccus xiamenensis]
MEDLLIRKDRRAGRITFNRPQALNALTHDMALAIHAALNDWRNDPGVDLVIIDAAGDKAFCAGGDIAAVYHAGRAGNHAEGERFFHDEYRMNAAIADYPKPILAFMEGFVMGGGVGVGGHASHRIVGDTTQIAMPESGIGLIPDVGGSWLLAHAPGHVGEYLTLTAARMGAGDALYAGFADYYLPEAEWPALIDHLADSGEVSIVAGHPAPGAPLADMDLSAFEGADMAEITARLTAQENEAMLKPIRRNSPLSMAAGLQLVRAARGDSRVQESLAREYRYTSRATRDSDFLEGVRAQIIDKDRQPNWTADASPAAVDAILAPLGAGELNFDE